jgi:hypothetical protein
MSEPTPRRTVSQESLRVQSASRGGPGEPGPAAPVSARLREGAADTALNAAGILRDLWGDFRRKDRFFKFKALIVGAWALLSAAGIVVACPGGGEPGNSIGARLVTSQVLDTQVFMIVNESDRTWEDVIVEVNGSWRASVPQVSHRAPGNTLTLDPRRLLGEGGKSAPAHLRVVDLDVRTSRGRARLMQQGRVLE